MCLRPATPGFLITVAATVCLVVVSFSVPWFKTVYFLKVSLVAENVSGDVTFGTLGYCLDLPGNSTCSSPKVGYQFDPNQLNQLLGLTGPIQIPSLFVTWLTYPLVLHIVGLILAAISAVFGLLAHVREMSMTCFSTCFSGFAATIVLIAFIFDLVIFFLARSRLNSVSGGAASIGNAMWLTLAAWLLLFFAGCAFGFGRCCISRRSPSSSKYGQDPDQSYSQAMRLDAIKAESDRTARQQTEVGLPAFPAVQDVETRPLAAVKQEPEYMYMKEEDAETSTSHDRYRDRTPSPGRYQSTSDLAAGTPLQSQNAPYQPIFRPLGSANSQSYAPLGAQTSEEMIYVAGRPRSPSDRDGQNFYSGHSSQGLDFNQPNVYSSNPSDHLDTVSPQSMHNASQQMPNNAPYATGTAARTYMYPTYLPGGTAAGYMPQTPNTSITPYQPALPNNPHNTMGLYPDPQEAGVYDHASASQSQDPAVKQPQAGALTYGDEKAGYQSLLYHNPGQQPRTEQLRTYQIGDDYQSPYLPLPGPAPQQRDNYAAFPNDAQPHFSADSSLSPPHQASPPLSAAYLRR